MTSNRSYVSTVPATSFEGEVLVSYPTWGKDQLPGAAQKWIASTGKHWPGDIAAGDLVRDAQLYYAAYWMVSGSASQSWRAEAEITHRRTHHHEVPCAACGGTGKIDDATENEIRMRVAEGRSIPTVDCPQCGGKGKRAVIENQHRTEWEKKGGTESVTLKQVIQSNSSREVGHLASRYDGSATHLRDRAEAARLQVIYPEQTSADAGQQIARRLLTEALNTKLRSAMGSSPLRNVEFTEMDRQVERVYTWLYPVYISHYTYEGKTLKVQVNGLTGSISVEKPPSVLEKERIEREEKERIEREERERRKRNQRLIAAVVIAFLFFRFVVPRLNPVAAPTLPTCSPDVLQDSGEKLTLESRADGDSDIVVIDLQGKILCQMTSNYWNDSRAAWSPDGKQLAFDGDNGGNSEIYIMDASTGTTRRMTYNDSNEWGVTWSPDGQRIAYTSNRDRRPEIYIMDLASREQTRLTTMHASSPAWSPQGDEIAYEAEVFGRLDVFVVKPDGSDVRYVTQTRGDFEGRPSWSPDGKTIAYISHHSQEPGLYLAEYETGLLTRITNQKPVMARPAWSPDGQRIAFGYSESQPEVYIINIDGNGLQRITNWGAMRTEVSIGWYPQS